MSETDKRVVSAVKQSVHYRNYRRARDRALVRLAQAHPEEYRTLLQEEKTKDEAEGKTWTSDGITLIAPTDVRTGPRTQSALRPIETDFHNGEEGNVG